MTIPFPDPQQPEQLAEPLADPNRTVADLSSGGDDNPLSRAPTVVQREGPLEMAQPVVPGYQILECSAAAAWASSTRRGRSASIASSPSR